MNDRLMTITQYLGMPATSRPTVVLPSPTSLPVLVKSLEPTPDGMAKAVIQAPDGHDIPTMLPMDAAVFALCNEPGCVACGIFSKPQPESVNGLDEVLRLARIVEKLDQAIEFAAAVDLLRNVLPPALVQATGAVYGPAKASLQGVVNGTLTPADLTALEGFLTAVSDVRKRFGV